MSGISDADAIREFLLDLLSEMPSEMLETDEGRTEIAERYLSLAKEVHPAVASVLQEAAHRVRSR